MSNRFANAVSVIAALTGESGGAELVGKSYPIEGSDYQMTFKKDASGNVVGTISKK